MCHQDLNGFVNFGFDTLFLASTAQSRSLEIIEISTSSADLSIPGADDAKRIAGRDELDGVSI